MKFVLLLILAALPQAVYGELVVDAPGSLTQSSEVQIKGLQDVEIKENLGAFVPKGLAFTDELGNSVVLGDFLKSGKPVVLSLVYYECPMLCTLVLNGLTQGLSGLKWKPGGEYQMVTVSINPNETAELAAAKRQSHLNQLGKGEVGAGWKFLVGNEAAINELAETVGFGFKYDENTKEYAHPAVTFILTPEGKISRYLYGVQYTPRDLKLAMLEASQGRIGSAFERFLLYCYRYDPKARGYVLFAVNLMRVGGGVAVLLLTIFLGFLWRRDAAKHNPKASKTKVASGGF